MFGGIEFQQQHDENAVVWQLLEFCLPNIMVLDQHPNYDAQHLDEQSKSNKHHQKKNTVFCYSIYLDYIKN